MWLTMNTHISNTYVALVAIITILITASCTSAETERNIHTADSLTDVDAKAALAFIDSVTHDGGLDRSERMKFALLKAKARNKLYLPADTAMLDVLAEYYDGHGTANDRMLVKYVIACSYVDREDAPRALQYFHEAAAEADTTDAECNYKTLSKIHSQTAELLHEQNASDDALMENALAFKYAIKAKDTLNALLTIEQKANIYSWKGLTDSVVRIRKELYKLYKKSNYPRHAAMALGVIISTLAERGNISEAKKCINIYEKESGLLDANGNIERGREIYYYTKGVYYLKIDSLDTAENLFRKCCINSQNFACLDFAFHGLSELFKLKGEKDSVIKYLDISRKMKDAAYDQMTTRHLQQMQAMYNYDHYKQVAVDERKNTANAKIFGLMVAIVIMCVSAYIIFKSRNKRKRNLAEYKRNIAEMERTKSELSTLLTNKQDEIKRLIDEKTTEMVMLQQRLQEYEKKISSKKTSKGVEALAHKPIVKKLRQCVTKEMRPMTSDECNELKELFNKYKPLAKLESTLKDTEYEICLLVKLEFTPSEISILTQRRLSDISNIRKRLLQKMTGVEGSSKDFDNYIKSL